jgi:hypothetical protein
MNEKYIESEETEEVEASGFMSYEDLMEARKITFSDVKEHLTGPVLSTIIHIVLLAFLGTIVVFKAPEKSKEITVEMKTIEPQEIEPPPPPPEPPDPVEVETPTDTPIESPEVEVEVDVQVENISVDSPNEIDMPNVLNLKISNSALKLSVPAGGGRKGGGKIGSGFGYGSKAEGDLVGVLYDLKTTPQNKKRGANYWGDVQAFIDNKFKPLKENPFRRLDKKLFTSHIYIPKMPAGEGPEQFGVADKMQPSQFFVHYSGEIHPTTEFRFAGSADDMIVVSLNNEIVFDGSWEHSMRGYTPDDTQKYPFFIGWPMTFGHWVKPGKYRIDILFGERPGGVIGGALLIQEKNKTYRKESNGRPLLPIFTTSTLTKEEKKRLKDSKWTIETDGPVMLARKVKVAKEKAVTGLEIK